MRRDHRPLWLIKAYDGLEAAWARQFLYPQFEQVGEGCHIARPWHVKVNGPGVLLGRFLHMRATRSQNIWFTAWPWKEGPPPRIDVGDFTLITPGVRISSSQSVTIGRGSMLASYAYITDSDWHGTYDRTVEAGQAAPVVLEENVWIGDSAIVCKGVTIGENSIIGAGAVVTRDIPANVIAAGAPAVPVKDLDPDSPRTTRMDMFSDIEDLRAKDAWLRAYVAKGNSTTGWLKHRFFPGKDS